MKCKKCGEELQGEFAFCPKCGEKVEQQSSEQDEKNTEKNTENKTENKTENIEKNSEEQDSKTEKNQMSGGKIAAIIIACIAAVALIIYLHAIKIPKRIY